MKYHSTVVTPNLSCIKIRNISFEKFAFYIISAMSECIYGFVTTSIDRSSLSHNILIITHILIKYMPKIFEIFTVNQCYTI